jgi:HPt (histidine-containing phosphotransfer) domain-containing protein
MSGEAFDREELLEEIDDDWEFLEESVDMLKEDASGLLARIRSGIDTRDAEMVWQNAHTIKSMVGNFAAKPAFEAAYAIETRGRANDLAAVGPQVDQLDAELQRLTCALDVLLSCRS